MASAEFAAGTQVRQRQFSRQLPAGCAACSNRRPGWFCSLGSSVLADLELATSTISLPAQASLFNEGEDARCLYLICGGYLKLTAGSADAALAASIFHYGTYTVKDLKDYLHLHDVPVRPAV